MDLIRKHHHGHQRCDACDAGPGKQQFCCVCGLPTGWSWLRILPSATRWVVGLSAREGRHGSVGRVGMLVSAYRHRMVKTNHCDGPDGVLAHTQAKGGGRQGKPQALRHATLGARTTMTDRQTRREHWKGQKDAIERRRDTAWWHRLDEPLGLVHGGVSMEQPAHAMMLPTDGRGPTRLLRRHATDSQSSVSQHERRLTAEPKLVAEPVPWMTTSNSPRGPCCTLTSLVRGR